MKRPKLPHFLLDNTLRYLYISLRNTGALLMAIEFTDRAGNKWRADTIEEAVALREKLSRIVIRTTEHTIKVWTPDSFEELINGIGENQRAFLRELMNDEVPHISSETIAKHMR